MSLEAFTAALNAQTGLGVTSKMVLVGLANHANPDGKEAWPAVERIAHYAEVNERTVQRHLRRLLDAGFIEVQRESTRRFPTIYAIRLDRLAQVRWGDNVPPLTARGDNDDGSGAATTTIRGDADVTRTVLEPSLEPSPITSPFDAFWIAYPRKAGKAAARRQFAKALREGADWLEIVRGAERYRDDPNREPSYTAHPSTWLYHGRWEDDPLPPREGSSSIADQAARLRAVPTDRKEHDG